MKHLTLIILAFFILIGRPVYAQEVTQEAVIVATEDPSGTIVEDGGTVINIDVPETPVEASDASPLAFLGVLAAGLVGIIVAISYGLQGVGNRANQAVNNPLEIAVLEKAHDSIPAPFVKTIVEPLQSALERTTLALLHVSELLKEASDKTPKSEKPITPITPANVTNIHEAGGAVGGDAEFR